MIWVIIRTFLFYVIIKVKITCHSSHFRTSHNCSCEIMFSFLIICLSLLSCFWGAVMVGIWQLQSDHFCIVETVIGMDNSPRILPAIPVISRWSYFSSVTNQDIDWMIEECIRSLHRVVQFHDSTDSLVQGQLKGVTPRKHTLVYIEILHPRYSRFSHSIAGKSNPPQTLSVWWDLFSHRFQSR